MDIEAVPATAPAVLGRERELAVLARLVDLPHGAPPPPSGPPSDLPSDRPSGPAAGDPAPAPAHPRGAGPGPVPGDDPGGAVLPGGPDDAPGVLVLVGEPGAGKSTLVAWTLARAAAAGRRVLRVRGGEGESGLCFAGLHQLLHPVLDGLDRLPGRQRAAVRRAFGLDDGEDTATPDPLPVRLGVLTLLSDAAARRPLLIAVDDAQWLDAESLDVLAFVARRLDGGPVTVLLAARDGAVPARFGHGFARLTAGPLDRTAAGLLLAAQPQPPHGRIRARILEQAAGNPLALVELTRAHAADPGRADTGPVDSLPLTDRLERIFAADLPALPAATRRALLLAAAAGTAHLADVLRAAPDTDGPAVWQPAERAGLVRIEDGRVRLRHPLVRSAVYRAASFAERRDAHLALAEALADEPDRRAWHLAAAALGPDEPVADALARSAERSRQRGGYAAAAAALERAAELTPDPERRARRLLAAASAAMYAGHPQWVGELTARIDGLTEDRRLLAEASLLAGWSLAVTLRHDDALGFLLPAAEAAAADAPALTVGALATAATPAYNSGDPYYRGEIRRIRGLVAPLPGPRADVLWSEASGHPFEDRARLLADLDRLTAAPAEHPLSDLIVLGATAWVLDRTEQAVQLLGRARDHHRRTATAGTNCTVAQALALALFEHGSWSAALTAAEDAFCMAAEAGADNVTVGAPILQATLAAVRGDHAGARARAAEAVRGRDLRRSRSLTVRHRQALGLAALAEGDHRTAYEQLRRTFTRDFRPAPVHHHASPYHLADLAAAAVRAGQADDARTVLDAVEPAPGADHSARLAAVLHRARGLLAEDDRAERHFRAATAPAGAAWPFEYALAHLDFGEWLRRRRRPADARPLLTTALDVFERLDARPWAERAVAELRAAGVAVAPAGGPATGPDGVADLTPQELLIARLAAEGLTNRDIGTRLHLSPRTVGFHLHKIFPKLGVTGRTQLRDALAGHLDG